MLAHAMMMAGTPVRLSSPPPRTSPAPARPRGARGEVVRAGVQEVAELASNLGALDFTTAGPPAADWDVYATVSKDSFEPGSVIVNPPAIFGSLVLGLVALDSSLRSMSAPSLSGALDKKLKEQRQKRRLEELEAANAATRAALELQRQEDRADDNTPV